MVVKGTRQITFRIKNKLWEDFTIKAVKDGTNKTEVLLRFIKEYLGQKKLIK